MFVLCTLYLFFALCCMLLLRPVLYASAPHCVLYFCFTLCACYAVSCFCSLLLCALPLLLFCSVPYFVALYLVLATLRLAFALRRNKGTCL